MTWQESLALGVVGSLLAALLILGLRWLLSSAGRWHGARQQKPQRPGSTPGLQPPTCIELGNLFATPSGYVLEVVCNARCSDVSLNIEYLLGTTVVQSEAGTYDNLKPGSNHIAIIPAPPLLTFDAWDGIRVNAKNRSCRGCGVRIGRHDNPRYLVPSRRRGDGRRSRP